MLSRRRLCLQQVRTPSLAAALLLLCGSLSVAACHSGGAVAMVAAADMQDTAPVPRTPYGRRLEPEGNTVLHGAGQTDLPSFIDYSDTVAPARPTVFMTYVDLRDNLPGYFTQLRSDLLHTTSMRSVVPQIGLSLNRGEAGSHYESETARGADDRSIDALCAGLASLKRPVFLRPGYEFNGAWNGYAPTSYVAAFRRIAARVHTCAPQAALLWDWSADAELDAEAGGNTAPPASRWKPYYPGDDAVDWWALNLFTPASIRSSATAAFLTAAAQSRHPVMIAESTPKGLTITGAKTWADWFQPYFTLIHKYGGIRAFCYINWDWSIYPQWADWGDARIQTAPPELRDHLRKELERPLYLKP